MEYPQDIEQRLTDLEIKASFTEDMVDQLNQIIVRQQQQIDMLIREQAQLRQQIPEGGVDVFSRSGEELPPHY
jgi:SlyX protein